MSRFLRLGAFLSVLFFATNVFAAGYTCPSYKRYTSCNEGYYLSSEKAGNSCLACPDGYTCSGGTSQPEKAAVANVSIVLNKNGGSGTCAGASGTNKGEVTCTPGNTCTLPSWNSSTCSITNGNKIFKGWSTSSSATTGVTSITTPNASVTYYAVWVTPTCSATNAACEITTPSNNAPRAKITCKDGYSQNGGTNTTTLFTVTGSAGATSVSGTCLTLNKYTCAAGKYLNGATCTTCDAGYYCPAGTWTYNGGVQGRKPCGGNTKYSSSGAAECSDVSSGYYTTGGTSTTRTGQSQCTGATYCSSGVKYDCPSGYTADTSNGKTAASQCTISVVGGKYIGTANSATLSTCAAGTYKSAHAVAYGSTSSCSACTGRLKYSASGASSCSAVSLGYYTTGCNSSSNNCTGQSQCTGATYCSSGVKYDCPSGYTANTSNGKTVASQCQISCAAGTRVVKEYATCTSPAGAWFSEATKTTYGNITPVNYCMNGYTSSGTTAAAHDAVSDCIQTVAGGKYVGSTKINARYIRVTTAGSTANTGSHVVEIQAFASNDGSGTNLLLGKGGLSGSNMTAATDGSWEIGNYASGTMVWDMGAKQSIGSILFALYTDGRTYRDVTVSVSIDNSTWTKVLGPIDITTHNAGMATGELIILSDVPTSCSAGTARASGTLALGTTNSCSACGAVNKYSAAGASACSTVSTGYYTTGGTTTTRTGQSQCTSGTYCTGGVQNTCPSGYGASAAGSDAATDCYMSVAAKKYVKTANDSTATACGTGTYKAAHTVYYGGTSTCDSCPSGYDDGAAVATQGECVISVAGGKYVGTAKSATLSTCAGGTYKAAHTVAYGATSSCATCSAGYYCPAGASSQTACGGNTKYSGAGAAACSDVSSGYYTTGGTTTTRTGQTKCEAGNYCSSGVKTACGGGKWSSAGATSCSSITAGCYGTSAGSACPAVCGDAQYSDAGAASCSGCPTDYKNSGTSASNHAGSASCMITVDGGYYIGTAGDNSSNWDKCAGGTYKASHKVAYGSTSSCATCSAGYYCPEGASGQTACGGNTKYSGSGASSCSTVSSGYYTTGGTSTTRTGQTKCEAGNYCSGGVKTACGGGKYSAAGATSCSNITAGCYGTSASTACPAVCGENQYSATGSSSCSSCPTDYKNSGTTAASHAGAASCIITVSGGYYIGTAGDNSSNWDKCAGGTYKASHTVAYGSTSSCATCSAGYYCPAGASGQTACGGNTKYSGSGAAACSDVSSGYYTTGGTATTRTGQTKCEAGNYCSGGVKTACGGGKYSAAGATSCSNITAGCYGTSASTACPAVCATNTYSTAGSSSCSSCPTDYKNSGTTAASHAGVASCIITVSGGYYIGTAGDNSSNWDKCAAGTYKASHTVAYGSTSSCSACTGRTKYSASGASSCSTVSTGYYTTGCNSSGNGCTAQSQCTGAEYYCTDGVQHECPSATTYKRTTFPSDYYSPTITETYLANWGNGKTSASECVAISWLTSSRGKLYEYDYYNPSTGKYDTHVDHGWSDVNAGYYLTTKGTCGAYAYYKTVKECPEGSYCPGKSRVACNSSNQATVHTTNFGLKSCSGLEGGLYPNSAAGATSASSCYTNSISGKYIATENASSATNCAAGTYKGAHTVNYGSTSSCATCSAGYYCPAGASSQTACGSNAKYSGSGAAACSDVSTGYYSTGGTATTRTGQTKCEAGNYCSSGVKTACSTLASGFYPNSAAGSYAAADCYTNVLSGKYVASANATGATSCAAGKFKGAHVVNYGSTSSCDACALGSYSAAGASVCTACQSGKTTSGTGKSSCDATCENNNSYDSTWATATWSDNAVANLCQIATCAGGSKYASVSGGVAGVLPSGYTQLAYLESTGTQAIDTKTVLQTDNVEFEWTAVDKSTASATSLFGSETSSAPKYTGILHGSNTSRALYYGSTSKGVGYSAGAELASWKLLFADTVKLYKNHVMVSSELAASSLQKSLPIAVFANNWLGSMIQFSSVQMYSFKIWDGGNLVLNLIPAMRDSDGVLGMYDTVNNKFLVNAGSGKFVAGPMILKSQNTCTQCSAGTYSAGGTATSCGTCANWTYSSAGAASCSACLAVPDAVGGVAWTKATGTGWTSYSNCVVSQTPANCASGSVKRTQSSASAWGSTTLVSALKSNAGYYASTTATSCTICPAGSYCAANATAATDCPGSMSSDTGSDAITDCKISCDAGYMLAAGASACSACSGGYYCAAGATYNYNATAVQGRTGKVTAGYYSSGGGLSATGTCLSGYSCGSCSTGTGANGRLLYSDAGAASCSECPAATGTLANRVTGYHGWWSNNIHSMVTGCYAFLSDSDDTATFITQCYYNATDGTYGGTNSFCQTYAPTECAGGYYSVIESATEWVSSSERAHCLGVDCMKGKVCGPTDAGYYSPAGATTQTACAIGSYTDATVKSACTACSAGKTTTGTGKTSCDANCSNATGVHTWATPSWSANSVANLCTVSKCNANTYYTATTGNGYKNTCTACGSNSSTSAGNTSTTCTCTTGYTSTGGVSGATTSTSGCSLISDIACAIGQYLPASSTSCLACTAGYYCPSSAKTYSYSSSIQGRKACSAGTYQPDTGKTSCTPASKGYYVSGTAKTEQTACTGATYAADTGQSSCTACPTATNDTANVSSYSYWNTGATGDHTDRSGCSATFKSKTLDDGVMAAYTCYVDSGADTYGVDGTSKTCVVLKTDLKCNGGYYNSTFNSSSTAIQDKSNKTLTNLYANACQNVGAGYWSANDSLTRTACASPLTTIGYGTGANEAEDCGRKLHAGANVIYLRSAQRSSPSLRVKVGDTTFYGALSTSLSSPVKVKNGSTTYSVVNDWQ